MSDKRMSSPNTNEQPLFRYHQCASVFLEATGYEPLYHWVAEMRKPIKFLNRFLLFYDRAKHSYHLLH